MIFAFSKLDPWVQRHGSKILNLGWVGSRTQPNPTQKIWVGSDPRTALAVPVSPTCMPELVIVGFYCIYGFAACVALVLLATEMRKVIMRDEDYYDD